MGEQQRGAEGRQAGERHQDGGLGADAVLQERKGQRAQAGGDVQADAEDQHLGRRQAELAGGVDAAEREQRRQPVHVQ